MKFWEKIKSAFSPVITNAVYSQDVYDAFGALSSGSAGMAVNATTALRVAAVYACVQKISGAISTLPLHIYSTDGDIKSRLPRDDLWYKLNEQPCTQYTAASHWEAVSVAQLLRGDAYTWIRRGNNNVIREFLPLPWGAVQPIRHTDGKVRYYINLPEFGITTWLEPSDILHFPGFGFNGLHSISVIAGAARAAVGNALAMDSYAGKFFENGAHPSIILQSPGKMNPDQVTALQAAFVSKYAGNDNAHKIPLILTEGLTAQEISLSATDAQLLEARKFQVIDIARAFGVPPHMIGSTEASTSWGTGIEAMSRGFVTYTLQPHLVRIEQELNRKLFPNNPLKFVQFDRDALIEGDSAAQAAYNRAALGGPGTGMGWMSVDEVRKSKGLAPIGGASADIFDPRSMKPATTATSADPAPVAAMASMASSFMAIANKETPPPVINITMPEINLEATMPEQQPVVVNVKNEVQVPTVQVDVVNQVNPADVTVTNNTVIEPANVTVTLPARRTEGTVERDSDGSITKTITVERDL